jgi:hypothetical protein
MLKLCTIHLAFYGGCCEAILMKNTGRFLGVKLWPCKALFTYCTTLKLKLPTLTLITEMSLVEINFHIPKPGKENQPIYSSSH